MLHYKLPFMLPFTVIFLLVIMSWKIQSYAEVHYTFFRYSLISRRYPEILVDMPWRVDAGEPIPIVCIVKDADRFPIKLRRIIASYKMGSGEAREKVLLPSPIRSAPLHIADQYWNALTSLELPRGQTGDLEVTVSIDFLNKGIKRTVISDNLPGLSHAPFDVFVSPCKLPALDGWYCGDPHYHSDMTQDQVEFGAPVEIAAAMGKAMGLSWLAATDHSYDLDRAMGEYFEHDPKLARWRRVREHAELVNSKNDGFVVIPAEEVSCGNCKSRNIHLLVFDTPQFIPGRGDGVKRGLNKKPDLTLRQCFNRINNFGGFAYAAHPEVGNGFFGTLLLNRDHWRDPDYAQSGYSGLQFWNGEWNKKFSKSYEKWIQLLLEGRRLYILGGNDAHGDFNRCRKVKYPNTKLAESGDHVFGKTRTYVYCGTGANALSVAGILDALRNGRTVVTNGPLAILQARNDIGQTARIGDDIAGKEFTLKISARSSEEFGSIDKITLYRGDLLKEIEQIERTFVPESKYSSETTHVFTHKLDAGCRMPVSGIRNRCYVRVEATSSARGEQYICFTNPIWLRSA
jgi:hypothetical protein